MVSIVMILAHRNEASIQTGLMSFKTWSSRIIDLDLSLFNPEANS